MGRRKIKIRKIVDNRARNATLKKRRQGLFKKAFELATLCDTIVSVTIQNKDLDIVSEYRSAEDCQPSIANLRRQDCQGPADFALSSPPTKRRSTARPIDPPPPAPLPPVFEITGLEPVVLMQLARLMTSSGRMKVM